MPHPGLLFALAQCRGENYSWTAQLRTSDSHKFLLLQAQMNVGQAQADQQVSERAQQLAAEKVQLEQQQAKLARQEAELSGRQTAFEERLTAHNMTHSRLTGAALRDFSFAVSILLVLTCFDDILFALASLLIMYMQAN